MGSTQEAEQHAAQHPSPEATQATPSRIEKVRRALTDAQYDAACLYRRLGKVLASAEEVQEVTGEDEAQLATYRETARAMVEMFAALSARLELLEVRP